MYTARIDVLCGKREFVIYAYFDTYFTLKTHKPFLFLFFCFLIDSVLQFRTSPAWLVSKETAKEKEIEKGREGDGERDGEPNTQRARKRERTRHQ